MVTTTAKMDARGNPNKKYVFTRISIATKRNFKPEINLFEIMIFMIN